MKCFLLALCTLFLLTEGDDGKPSEKDLKLLNGTWKVVSMVHNGKDIPNAEDHGITFDGENVTIKEPNGGSKGKCTRLDPTKDPKEIDLTPDGGGKKLQGIYELKGDELKLCLTRSDERPSRFESKEGSNSRLVVLKREK
jgi:uncharacterized protein (TIGR03067 family)